MEFLEKFITEKHKNKIIILDNASAHINDTISDLVNKKLLYSVPYQHFSMLKYSKSDKHYVIKNIIRTFWKVLIIKICSKE